MSKFVLTTITSRFPQFQVETPNILKVFIKFSITIVNSPRPHLGVLLGGHEHLGGEPHRLLIVDVHVRRVLAGPRRPPPALHPRDLCSRRTLSHCQDYVLLLPLT